MSNSVKQHLQTELLELLDRVKTIALVGASPKAERPSNEVMAFLQQRGFRVIPINPGLAGQELLGETVYAQLSDLPIQVDMVEIFRNSEAAGTICQEVLNLPKDKQAWLIWMQIGVINEEAASLARKSGIEVVMDHCPKRVLHTAQAIAH